MQVRQSKMMGGSGKTALAEFLAAASKRYSKQHCYEMGHDCGINGPNAENCDFRLFASPDHTHAWEQGKADAERKAKTDEI